MNEHTKETFLDRLAKHVGHDIVIESRTGTEVTDPRDETGRSKVVIFPPILAKLVGVFADGFTIEADGFERDMLVDSVRSVGRKPDPRGRIVMPGAIRSAS